MMSMYRKVQNYNLHVVGIAKYFDRERESSLGAPCVNQQALSGFQSTQIDHCRHIGYSCIHIFSFITSFGTTDFKFIHDRWNVFCISSYFIKYLEHGIFEHTLGSILQNWEEVFRMEIKNAKFRMTIDR